MISLIISSFNQVNTLYYSLQSAINQKINEGDEFEIILADNNSTDGTHDMVSKYFPNVIISINEKNTLISNWASAVTKSKGERLIFTNSNVLFSSGFVNEHNKSEFGDNMIFGEYEYVNPTAAKYFDPLLIKIKDNIISQRYFHTYKEVVKMLAESNRINKELPVNNNNTVQKNVPPILNNYNFSVIRNHFDTIINHQNKHLQEIEAEILFVKIINRFNINIIINKKAYSIYL